MSISRGGYHPINNDAFWKTKSVNMKKQHKKGGRKCHVKADEIKALIETNTFVSAGRVDGNWYGCTGARPRSLGVLEACGSRALSLGWWRSLMWQQPGGLLRSEGCFLLDVCHVVNTGRG